MQPVATKMEERIIQGQAVDPEITIPSGQSQGEVLQQACL